MQVSNVLKCVDSTACFGFFYYLLALCYLLTLEFQFLSTEMS